MYQTNLLTMAKKKAARNLRKKTKFQQKRAGMNRTEWAKFKRDNKLPKIVTGNAWRDLLKK